MKIDLWTKIFEGCNIDRPISNPEIPDFFKKIYRPSLLILLILPVQAGINFFLRMLLKFDYSTNDFWREIQVDTDWQYFTFHLKPIYGIISSNRHCCELHRPNLLNLNCLVILPSNPTSRALSLVFLPAPSSSTIIMHNHCEKPFCFDFLKLKLGLEMQFSPSP